MVLLAVHPGDGGDVSGRPFQQAFHKLPRSVVSEARPVHADWQVLAVSQIVHARDVYEGISKISETFHWNKISGVGSAGPQNFYLDYGPMNSEKVKGGTT